MTALHLSSHYDHAPASQVLSVLAAEAHSELQRIEDWWTNVIVDHARGGFFGAIDAEGRPRPGVDKSVVLNTRLLWFFSEGADRLGSPDCLLLADRAARYISDHFLDPRGGLFWMVDADGVPIDRRKQAYAQAFGVYAFAAHYAATRAPESLETALALFNVLETHFHDLDGDGYWEALGEDFSPVADMRLSDRDLNAPKTMNAHLHILEAYAALYRVHRAHDVANALSRAIGLMCTRVRDPDAGHLRLFFDAQWRPIDRAVSFGHDIEASWLIWEAAEALDLDYVLPIAKACALDLVEATLAEAVGPNGEVFEGRADAASPALEARVWWMQAEGMVGLLNAYELTGERRFLDACAKLWRFIKRSQIDPQGEWREFSALDRQPVPAPLMAGPWKCPYHTGRAMMEVERRAVALLRREADAARGALH